MFKSKKYILIFTLLSVLLAIGVMAINYDNADEIKAAKAERIQAEKPTLKSNLSDTPQGQIWDAAVQAKYEQIAADEAKLTNELLLQQEQAAQQDAAKAAEDKEEWRPGNADKYFPKDSYGKLRGSKIVSHKIVKYAPNTVFLSEDFEDSLVFPPPTWDTINTDPGYGYFNGRYSGGGSRAALVTWDGPGFIQDEWLLTPSVDVSSATAAELKLDFWMLQGYAYPHDFNVHVSTDGGATWTFLWSSSSVAYPEFEWYFVSLDISAYATETDLAFGFQYYGEDADLFGLDDISINDDVYVEPTGRCCTGDPFAPTCDDGMTEADCVTLGGTWAEGLNCTDDPCPVAGPNDNCADVTPEALPFTFVGNNEAATFDTECQYFTDYPNVWTAFTIDECSNVNISYCGSPADWGNGWLNLITDCSCAEGTLIDGATYAFDCANGNPQIQFNGLPAGTYYYPIMLDPTNGAAGDYVIEITSEVCPPAQPGDNCTDPLKVELGALPFTIANQYTCGRGDSYNATCLGSYDGGEDLIIELTVTDAVVADITLDPKGTTYSGFSISDACPDNGGVCIASETSSSGSPKSMLGVSLAPGVYYIMVDTWPSPDCIPDLDIIFEEAAPAEPGDNCLEPLKIDIPSLPYSDLGQTTCGRVDDYDATDLGFYDGGEDIIYEVTVSVPTDVNITLDPKGTTYTGIAIFDLCPADAGAIALDVSTNSGSDAHGMNCVSLDVGTYYIMVDTWPSPDCIPDFDLFIEEAVGCEAPPNDNCDGAEKIGDVTALPFNTDLATFDGPGGCQTAPNLWYEYTASCDGKALISLCGSGYDTKMAVYDACGGTELACNDDACGLQSEVEVIVYAGQTLIIEVGGYGTNTGEGVLTTSCAPLCEVEIPAGAISEDEACGDDTNGGCNSVPEAFGSVACGETIHGNGWADGGTRDTDWYELVTTEWKEVTLTASAEFDFIVGFVDFADCALASAIDPNATGEECDVVSVTKVLPPGTYWIFVGPTVFEGYPCAAGPFDYYLTVDCQTAEPIACDASGGCDEYISNVAVGDINNASGCDGYADYKSLSTLMEPETGYPIVVDNGNGYSSDDCGIWVDWNGNLDFTDPGERVVMDVETGAGPYSATITPPAGTPSGNVTMRIRIAYSGAAADMQPCGSTTYGEVEDYTIEVGIPVEYVVEPLPLYAFQQFHIEPDFFDIYMSNAAMDGGDVNDMENIAISVNGSSVPLSSNEITNGVLVGMTGDAMKMSVDVTPVIEAVAATQPDGLIWGNVDSFFDVYYELSGVPGSYSGQFTIRGHVPGDFNVDGEVDISDLTGVVNYMFNNGDAPMMPQLIDVDGSGQTDIQDMVRLVNYMFADGPALTHP